MKKLNNQITTPQLNKICKDAQDTNLILNKDKNTCSPTELEDLRREKNRVHAKQTRLRKKKMTHEMEVVSNSFPEFSITRTRHRKPNHCLSTSDNIYSWKRSWRSSEWIDILATGLEWTYIQRLGWIQRIEDDCKGRHPIKRSTAIIQPLNWAFWCEQDGNNGNNST